PNYLPPQWSPHINPEGQLYFYKDATIPVVTEAYLYDQKVMERVDYWIKDIEDTLPKKGIVLSDKVELFIEVDDDNDCAFYFIDHHTRTQFWLDNVTTEDMGIDPVVSPSHLSSSISKTSLLGAENQMTSRSSTFPHDANECSRFVKLLRSFQGSPEDGYMRCVIARLYHLMLKHRVNTHYGQEYARLHRNQSILADTARESRVLHILTSLLTFGTSKKYVARLNNIYLDQQVYAHQWQPFIKDALYDWRTISSLALLAPISCLVFFFIPSAPIITFICASFFGISFMSSIFLIHRLETMSNATAKVASIYLGDIRSDRFKFQLAAFAYALPRASFFWGIVAYMVNCYIAASSFMAEAGWPSAFLWLAGIWLLAFIMFHNATSRNKLFRLLEYRWRREPESSPV
ncbi:hypothetical protein H0H93_006975, partial [Arthromyces matolae]